MSDTTLRACLLPPCRRHQAGNLGVEHAAPDAVQRALATARLSQPERKEFDREDLVALGLFTPMGAAQAEAQVTRRISRPHGCSPTVDVELIGNDYGVERPTLHPGFHV